MTYQLTDDANNINVCENICFDFFYDIKYLKNTQIESSLDTYFQKENS